MKHDISLVFCSHVVAGDSFSNLPQNGNDAASVLERKWLDDEVPIMMAAYANLTEDQRSLSPVDRLMLYNEKAYSKANPWGLGDGGADKLFSALAKDIEVVGKEVSSLAEGL